MYKLTRIPAAICLVALALQALPASAQTITPRQGFIHMMNAWLTRVAMLEVCKKPRRAAQTRAIAIGLTRRVLGIDEAAARARVERGVTHFVGFFRRALNHTDPGKQKYARRLLSPESCNMIDFAIAFEVGFHRGRLERQ